jgi:hypothetical protein
MAKKLKRISLQYVKMLRIIHGNHDRGFEFHADQYFNCRTVLNQLKSHL